MRAHLIDAATDTQLWAEKHDETTDDLVAVQERLARRVVETLTLRLTADEHRRLGERRVENVHAYECYLRARHQGGGGARALSTMPCGCLEMASKLLARAHSCRPRSASRTCSIAKRESIIAMPHCAPQKMCQQARSRTRRSRCRFSAARMDRVLTPPNPGSGRAEGCSRGRTR